MTRDDDMQLIDETVHLLEAVPFAKWPSFEVKPQPFTIVHVSAADDDAMAAHLAQWKTEQRRADNDFTLQVRRVRAAIEEIRRGRAIAFMWPDAPMRVAILLRKKNERALEKRFLAAFTKRYPDAEGYRFRKLVERLDKL